jgi:hypothetical protein
MGPAEQPDGRFEAWLAALDERHLADLTASEVGRALRALSSCYVERRSKLAGGGALGTAGKRAAFALFYAPIHFLITRHVVRSLALAGPPITLIQDLGCGTGSAGAAWALEASAARVSGVDRHPWAVAEANWTYRQLSIDGRAVPLDLTRARIPASAGSAIIAAYAINELADGVRTGMLQRLLTAGAGGAQVLIVEPISRRLTPWWGAWEAAFSAAGGQSDEWRFQSSLPRRQRELAKAAGLDPRELTARTLRLSGGQ